MGYKSLFFFIFIFLITNCGKNINLNYYKVQDFYIETYKEDKGSSDRKLIASTIYSERDSIYIGMSFKIVFCDSLQTNSGYVWKPTRGVHGILSKLKSINTVLEGIEKKATLPLLLVNDEFNYIVMKDNDKGNRTNSRNYIGCYFPIDTFINKLNSADGCYIADNLNYTYFLYRINSSQLLKGRNIIVFYIDFADYSIQKSVVFYRS